MSLKHNFQPVNSNPNFAQKEEELLDHWYQTGIVDAYLAKNQNAKKKFSFLDGPITANNPMGVHHGWGRTYKDFWQRLYNLKGYRQRFQNGFDCQGLWVEVEVEKELGFKTKSDIETYGVEKFVAKCRDRVHKFAAIQTKQSQRLGYFMDWDNSYFTMSDANNYMIWHFLKVCHQNGWIYQDNESVPWCPRCQTAISQHEMLTEDYKQVTHDSVYLKLPLIGKSKQFLLIWTTTPWTIPANIAVAVDPKLQYSLVQDESDDQLWVAHNLVDQVFSSGYQKIIKTVSGKSLVGLKYSGPFDHLPAVATVAKVNPQKFHIVVAADPNILPVTTAVSAGTEDFKLGKKLGLPMIPVIADDASYLDGFDLLTGKNAKKHPQLILDYLKEPGKQIHPNWVFRIEKYQHRYPACWRCKTELVWKVTPEWYIAMDQPGKASTSPKTLRQRMKAVAKNINWIPQFGLERELDWLSNMHDWLISKKNRYWGLALPIYQCSHCGWFDVIGSREELEKRAVSGWDKFSGHSPHKPHIDAVNIKCDSCGQPVSRISDVGNVWLDAGIVPFSTYIDPKTKKLSYTTDQKYWQSWFPADFITESFPGQFKNWFYSMIAMSAVLENTNPYKTVFGFASVLAEDGRPMHKSWGNAIEFNQGSQKIGVDVMRWLYLRHNPVNNLLFGYHTADQVRRRFILILWNSYRFFVSQALLNHWQPVPTLPQLTHPLDLWILSRYHSTLKNFDRYIKKYDTFHPAIALEDFVTDLSTWYIRRSRDRVHPSNPDHQDKHQCLAVMHYLFTNLSVVLSPFIPFISEHIYTNLTGARSVHLQDWPSVDSNRLNPELEQHMDLVRKIVESLLSLRQKHGLRVRQPLSAWSLNPDTAQLLQNDLQLLDLISSEVNAKSFVPFDNPIKTNRSVVHADLPAKSHTITVYLDTEITPELKKEGHIRDLIRQVQSARKQLKINPQDPVHTTIPTLFQAYPKDLLNELKSKTLTTQLDFSSKLSVTPEKTNP